MSEGVYTGNTRHRMALVKEGGFFFGKKKVVMILQAEFRISGVHIDPHGSLDKEFERTEWRDIDSIQNLTISGEKVG